MKQTVVIVYHADRHGGPGRDFTASYEHVVDAGSLDFVLKQLQENMAYFQCGRYTIQVTEPYEED